MVYLHFIPGTRNDWLIYQPATIYGTRACRLESCFLQNVLREALHLPSPRQFSIAFGYCTLESIGFTRHIIPRRSMRLSSRSAFSTYDVVCDGSGRCCINNLDDRCDSGGIMYIPTTWNNASHLTRRLVFLLVVLALTSGPTFYIAITDTSKAKNQLPLILGIVQFLHLYRRHSLLQYHSIRPSIR